MSWFDPSELEGFSEAACETLRANPFVANEPGRLDKIKSLNRQKGIPTGETRLNLNRR